jgi:type IV secretion system protein VirD4
VNSIFELPGVRGLQLPAVGSALLNLARAVKQDPVWAIVSVVVSPIRAAKHVFSALALFLAIGIAVAVVEYFLPVGLPRDHWARLALKLGGLGVGLVAVWRVLTFPLLTHFGPRAGDVHGSARFADRSETADLYSGGGLLIGRDKTGELMTYNGPAHLLTMAPTRSGKGVGTIIPNLIYADRSVICVDPKGENARVTGRLRGHYGQVYCLDPFEVSGRRTSSFNPLAGIKAHGLDVAEDAANIADALVFDAPGEGGDAHWNEEAKALIGGLVLQVVTAEPSGRRHLGTLREYLTLDPAAWKALLTTMAASSDAGGLVARAANRQRGKSDKEATGVLSAAQRHTHFLDSPRMVRTLERSDFEFAELKASPVTVFLILPPDRLSTYARWLRLMIAQSLQDLARTPGRPAAPVLYLLDEFAALGALAPVERAMGLMAGYGVQMWPILQDIHQLKDTYGKRAGTFLSNAAVLQVFGTNDQESARMISDMLGQTTVSFQTMSRSMDAKESGISYSEQMTGRALLTPDEVRTLPAGLSLLFVQGKRPIVAGKLRYFADSEFAGLFDSDD